MNQELDYRSVIAASLPGASVHASSVGVCVWVDIVFNDESFVMQITPNDGIGVSKQDLSGDSDLSGHDKAFGNLVDAVNYIRNYVD